MFKCHLMANSLQCALISSLLPQYFSAFQSGSKLFCFSNTHLSNSCTFSSSRTFLQFCRSKVRPQTSCSSGKFAPKGNRSDFREGFRLSEVGASGAKKVWKWREGSTMASAVTSCSEVAGETLKKDEAVVGGKGEEGNCVKAVLFDLDDTLVLTHAADKVAHKAVEALAKRHVPHVDGAEMVKVFVEKFDVSPWDSTHQVEVTEWRARIWNEALQSQGVDDMALARDMQNLFDKERMFSFHWAPGVEAMVSSLHKLGIKVGIITNGHFTVQRTKLKMCRADLLFETILVGGEERNQKPHKDIFLKACKLAKCKPEETIMVGDNLKTDIQGGNNAGFLATVWVNLHNLEIMLAGDTAPDYVIANIGELPGLLRELKVDLGSNNDVTPH